MKAWIEMAMELDKTRAPGSICDGLMEECDDVDIRHTMYYNMYHEIF